MKTSVIHWIKAFDEQGITSFHLGFSSLENAEKVFDGITHDDAHQDVYWQLFSNGELINWHRPKGFKSHAD